MVRLVRVIDARLLPHGWGDLARQLLLFIGPYYGYQIVRGLVSGRVASAYQNARGVISIERSLHVFAEPAIQAWATSKHWLIVTASWAYPNLHLAVTLGALLWLYFFRNRSYYFVRNALLIAMGLALVCYLAFPTAPPRLLPEWGFSDQVAYSIGLPTDGTVAGLLVNPFAAVPSMHVAFAVLLGWPLVRLVRSRALKVLWASYPVLITFVVVATGNHFFLDTVLGALTAGVAAWLAHRVLARVRPHAWAFRAPSAEPAT